MFDQSVIKYPSLEIVQAHPDHADYLAPKLRAGDNMECMCMGRKPLDALHDSFKYDLATLTVLNNKGKPIGMFGVGEGDMFPYLWMLGTDEISKRYKKEFVKYSKTWVNELLKLVGGMAGNFVYKYNRPAVRWLRWVGAEFLEEVEFNKEPFYNFILINNNEEEKK